VSVFERQLLDHGFLRLVESYGSDEAIISAARMSTAKGFLGWGTRPDCDVCRGKGKVYDQDESIDCPRSRGENAACFSGDEKLLRYLWENAHATPFEMAGAIIEVQAPIFVFREWFGYNELSSRYTPLPDMNYVPTVERLMMGGGHLTKQAGTIDGAETLTVEAAEEYRRSLEYTYQHAEQVYQSALNKGVPKELARVHLPVGRYSRMRATGNLRGWLAFLTLRQSKKAQYEIRVYAEALHDLLAELFPRTLSLFDEGRHA